MIFLLLHSDNFIGSTWTYDNLWQLLYIAQRNLWTFGSLWEWFGQRRFDTSKMRCANRRALDQSTGLETSLLLPLRLTFLSSSFIFFPQQSKLNLVPRTLLETIPPASAVYMMSLTSASQCPHWILHRLDQERKDFLNGWHDPQLRHPSSSLKAKLWHAAWQCLARSEENPYRRLIKWLPAYSKSPSSKRVNFHEFPVDLTLRRQRNSRHSRHLSGGWRSTSFSITSWKMAQSHRNSSEELTRKEVRESQPVASPTARPGG